MKRRVVARYLAGPFVIAKYNDHPGWLVTKPEGPKRLRVYWPVPFRSLSEAYRAVEDHLGITLTWSMPQPLPSKCRPPTGSS